MSAYDNVMNALGDATRQAALVRYRDEVRTDTLREAARTVRLGLIPAPLGEAEEAINDALSGVADLFDPDKP